MPKYYVEHQRPDDTTHCVEYPTAAAAKAAARRLSAKLGDLVYALRDDDGTGYTGQVVYCDGYQTSREGAPLKDAA